MKIGQFTSGYQRSTIATAFRDAAEFGYDYVELWGGRPHAYAPDLRRDGLAELRGLADRYSMPIRVYTPEHNAYPYNFMIGPEAQRRDAIDYLTLCMEVGKELGAEYTLFSTGHAGYAASASEIRDRLYRCVGELVSHAEATGCRLIVEALTPMETNVCSTANDLKELLDHFDSDALVAVCDIVVPTITQEPISGYFDKLGSRLAHLHIVDSDGQSETHLLPGEGMIPLPELMGYIATTSYSGSATIELVTAYLREPSLHSKRAIDALRAAMP
jgi:protein FrlC